jgi:hypothetical protein
LAVPCASAATSQPLDITSVVQRVDAAVRARLEGIASYTDTEHYAVFRNNDEAHPVAEMTVKTTYRKETGKTYEVESESGSPVIRKFLLSTILDNEKTINTPGIREGTWITSANYGMQFKTGRVEQINGRDCVALALTPRRKAPYLIEGTLWVDTQDGTIVKIEGIGSKSPSIFTGPTHMMRQYANIDGFAEATRARAESSSVLLGKTVVTIDYSGYQIRLQSGQ